MRDAVVGFHLRGVDLCPENESEQPMPKSLVRLMKRAESLEKKSRHRKSEKRPPSGTECKGSPSRITVELRS